MDIRLEPRTAAHPKREEIERLRRQIMEQIDLTRTVIVDYSLYDARRAGFETCRYW